jgi:FdhD protein
MSSKIFEARRFDEKGLSTTQECVVEEGALQIRVDGKPFSVTMRTPGDDRHLVMGLLFSEGLVETPVDLISLREEFPQGGTAVWSAEIAHADLLGGKISNRSLASTSSCGLCGKTEWDAPADAVVEAAVCMESSETFPSSLLSRCFQAMSAQQNTFSRTGGSHAAAVFSAQAKLLAFGEDVGRHNAVDKVVGDLWEHGRLREGLLLCVSGRVSYEIVAKVRRAGFAILAAVSAPSSLAVEFCRDSDITLVGFCRGDRATVYSHPERLLESVEESAVKEGVGV